MARRPAHSPRPCVARSRGAPACVRRCQMEMRHAVRGGIHSLFRDVVGVCCAAGRRRHDRHARVGLRCAAACAVRCRIRRDARGMRIALCLLLWAAGRGVPPSVTPCPRYIKIERHDLHTTRPQDVHSSVDVLNTEGPNGTSTTNKQRKKLRTDQAACTTDFAHSHGFSSTNPYGFTYDWLLRARCRFNLDISFIPRLRLARLITVCMLPGAWC